MAEPLAEPDQWLPPEANKFFSHSGISTLLRMFLRILRIVLAE
jgi:hypothetical protein